MMSLVAGRDGVCFVGSASLPSGFGRERHTRSTSGREALMPMVARTCEWCSQRFSVYISPSSWTGRGRFCTRTCHYAWNRSLKNTAPTRRRVTEYGYIRLVKRDHPRANKYGMIFEHRVVAEQMIGRPLRRDEVVHHKNGIKTDNRPENLEVTTNGAHTSMHLRERWLTRLRDDGVDPNTQRRCTTCRRVKRLGLFYLTVCDGRPYVTPSCKCCQLADGRRRWRQR